MKTAMQEMDNGFDQPVANHHQHPVLMIGIASGLDVNDCKQNVLRTGPFELIVKNTMAIDSN